MKNIIDAQIIISLKVSPRFICFNSSFKSFQNS